MIVTMFACDYHAFCCCLSAEDSSHLGCVTVSVGE